MDENNNYSNNTPLTLTRNENVNSHSFNPPANTGEIKEHVNQISSDFLGNNPNLDNTNKEPVEVTQKKKSNLRLFILFLVLDLLLASLIVYEVVTLFMKVAAGEI